MPMYYTHERAGISNQLWAVTSAVGAGLCFLALVVIAALYAHSASRAHLDRVSFRLMIYSLIANTVFGISSTLAGKLTEPSIGCGLSVFLLQLTLQVSSFLLFCIALNLQLVVVHGVRGRHIERYYVACSIVMALAITVPPYAAGQYGWDPLENVCWYTNDNQQQRLAWQIGTQVVWTVLTVVGEVVTACTVTTYMLRVHFRRKHIVSDATWSRSSGFAYPRRKSRYRPSPSMASLKPMTIHAHTYANVVFRIALYPLASCVINLTYVVTEIHASSTNGIHNANDYRILLLSDLLYGGRAVLYALLAVTDLALVRAVRIVAARYVNWPRGSTTIMRQHLATSTQADTSRMDQEDFIVQVEMSAFVASTSNHDDDGSKFASSVVGGKAREVGSASIGNVGEGDQVQSPAIDKAERGALADWDAGAEPPLNPPRPIASDIVSPTPPPMQDMRRRREELTREQAEEDEFMRII